MVLQIAVLSILARHLTPQEFGLVGAALIVVGIGELLVNVGFASALIQKTVLLDRDVRTAFTLSLAVGSALSVIVLTTSNTLASPFGGDEELGSVIRVLSPIFLVRAAGVVAEASLLRKKRFAEYAGVLVSANAIGFAFVGVTLALLGFGGTALVAATLTRTAVTTIAELILARHPLTPQLKLDSAKHILHFSGGQLIARIMNGFGSQAGNIAIGKILGLEALGFYGRANQIVMLPVKLIGDAVNGVFFPVLASVKTERKLLGLGLRRSISAAAILILPLSATLYVIAPELVSVLLGAQWNAIVSPLRILSVGIFFRVATKIPDTLAKATGHVYQRAACTSARTILLFIGAFAGTELGLAGVAAGVTLALGIGYILMMWLAQRLTRQQPEDIVRAHARGIAYGGVALLVSWTTSELCRAAALGPVPVILSTVAITGMTLLAIPRILPRVALGSDEIWLIDALNDALPWAKHLTAFILPRSRRVAQRDAAP